MNGTARQLRPEVAGPPAPVESERKAGRPPAAPLWLCLGLPRLPLEVRGGGGGEDEDARVVVDREGRVVRASQPAAEQGVAAGLPLNAALALCPELCVLARDETAERDALHRLAAWAGAFTPVVSLAPPAALLLEVRGSLRLFGGLESLRRRLRHALRATGHAGRDAVAPTPLAALWLARAGDGKAVTDPGALPGRLGRLPPAVTGWPEKTLAVLRDLGVESLADCLRLPRDGFARRIGRGPLEDLDRALGRLADPRPSFRAPPRYRAELELAGETTDTERLGRAIRPLFAELEGFLRGRQRAVSRVVIRFVHLQRAATALTLGLAGPGLEAARFQAVFEQHLERLALPAPVIGLALEAEPGEPLGATAAGLFGDEPDAAAGLRLVERLRARLGREAVHGVVLCDEHRPERAWAVAEPVAATYAVEQGFSLPAAKRPAWLLETPRSLRSVAGRPWCDGALSLESGPERLETGWWDGSEVARDYWIARTPAGARLWIFRDPPGPAGEPRWYLHGVFG